MEGPSIDGSIILKRISEKYSSGMGYALIFDFAQCLTDVSGQHILPIFKGKAIYLADFFLE